MRKKLFKIVFITMETISEFLYSVKKIQRIAAGSWNGIRLTAELWAA